MTEPNKGLSPDELSSDEQETVFSCCYCGDEFADEDDFKGVCLYNKDSGKGEQYWFCHEACFRDHLAPLYNVTL